MAELVSEIAGSDASGLILSAGILTTAIFLVSFGIFVLLAIKSRTIKSFQSQVSAFIGVYIAGELLELGPIQSAAGLPPELGSQLHLAATLVITTVMWSRLFYSDTVIRKLVDKRPREQPGE